MLALVVFVAVLLVRDLAGKRDSHASIDQMATKHFLVGSLYDKGRNDR